MAFYGRVSNDSKTSMTFDKVYPNRTAMDNAIIDGLDDGVFVGRFVLVEYDNPDASYSGDLTDETAIYNDNYRIDKENASYGGKIGHGYDATVWRKEVLPNSNPIKYKYVMLAELNSVVPTFNIVAEAPAEIPVKPYFSADSNNVYYNLHVGSNWGFKSTGNINIMQDALPVSAFYPEPEQADDISQAGALRPENNKIELSSVASGLSYGTNNIAQLDQKELTVTLPVIGGAVSKIWDALYGSKEAWNEWYSDSHNEDTIGNSRPVFTDPVFGQGPWNNGLRLISELPEGAVRFAPTRIGNVAGAINTMFDLIGQKVVEFEGDITDPDDVKNTLFDTIYYVHDETTNADEFYYKGYKYNFNLSPEDDDYKKNIIDPSDDEQYAMTREDEGSDNRGYQPYTGQISPATGDLYTKILADGTPLSERYIPINMAEPLLPDVKYYTLNSTYTDQFDSPDNQVDENSFITLATNGNLYVLTSSDVGQGIELTAVQADDEYSTTARYFKLNWHSDGVQKYFPSSTENTTYARVFVRADNQELTAYPTGTPSSSHIFYYPVQAQEATHPLLPDGTVDYSQTIYTTILSPVAITAELKEDTAVLNELARNNPLLPSLPVISKWPNTTPQNALDTILSNADEYTWLFIENGSKFVWRNSPPRLNSTTNAAKRDEILSGYETCHIEIEEITEFYKPKDKYWGKIHNSNELYRKISAANNSDPTYIITTTGLATGAALAAGAMESTQKQGVNGHSADLTTDVYFVPNQLYVKNGNIYELATNYNSSATYYKKFDIVVFQDPVGVFNVGELWNKKLDIRAINAERSQTLGNGNDVVVGFKKAIPTMLPLKDYARTSNTMNGWLLKLNQLLGEQEIDTRDKATIQGALNILNDKINGLGDLGPNALMVTDMYGHLNAAPLQSVTGDSWFEWTTTTSVDGTVSLALNHKRLANAVEITSDTFKPTVSGRDLTVYGPVIDTAGHVTGIVSATTTLPAGIISLSGDSWVTPTGTGESWSISHGAASTTTSASVDQTTTVTSTTTVSFGGTFIVPSVAIDAKGHVNSLSAVKLQLPQVDFSAMETSIGNLSSDIETLSGNLALLDGALASTSSSLMGSIDEMGEIITGYDLTEVDMPQGATNASLLTSVNRLDTTVSNAYINTSTVWNGRQVHITTGSAPTAPSGGFNDGDIWIKVVSN